MRNYIVGPGVISALVCLFSLSTEVSSQESAANSAFAVQADTAPLRPGDMVRLTIWPATEFSQDVIVDQNGVATFRRLGAINVSKEPPEKLRSTLINGFTKYVRNPSIEVVFLRRIAVIGAVQKPGLY